MSSSNLIRWGGLAAMLAGALFVAADLLSLNCLTASSWRFWVPGRPAGRAPLV